MAKKIGIIVLLCFSLCVGGVSAFANEGHDETDTQTLIETQPPVSSVLFRQDGADIQQSTDEGKTWQSYSPIEETDYFTYDEFSAWIENETENIQKLVDAGEWTEAEATEALEYYDEILKSILEGKMVGKRASSSDDQLFFSMPDNAQPEQYQTFVFDGNTYKSIAGGGGNTDNLHILQLSGDNGLALLLVVRGDHRHNVAALQLAGEPLRKTFDGHGDGLLAPVQAVQVGVFRCWGV